jgi:hypothetical protein
MRKTLALLLAVLRGRLTADHCYEERVQQGVLSARFHEAAPFIALSPRELTARVQWQEAHIKALNYELGLLHGRLNGEIR